MNVRFLATTRLIPVIAFQACLMISLANPAKAQLIFSDFAFGTGTLRYENNKLTTSGSDDFGSGMVQWSNLNTSTVSFTVSNIPGATMSPALVILQFGLAPKVAAPEPNSLTLLFCLLAFPVALRLGLLPMSTVRT